MGVNIVRVGLEQTPVIIIDDFVQHPGDLVAMAVAMSPFPSVADNYYPGVRRVFRPEDTGAASYVDQVCQGLAGLLHQVYGWGEYRVVEASFSMVTRRPEDLRPLQSIPHFDNPDVENIAILHYLSHRPSGGTAFYRHGRTGFENLTPPRVEPYLTALNLDLAQYGPPAGYFSGSGHGFEEIAAVEDRFNRAIIYPGSLLHSGIVPEGANFSNDPRLGRLTANVFIRALRPQAP